jgi:hypothetical protein
VINKLHFIKIYNKIYIHLNNEIILKLFYDLIAEKISEEEFFKEIEKETFRNNLLEYKKEKGSVESFYNQFKKEIIKNDDKRIIFLKEFNLKNIKELKDNKYPDIFYNEEYRKKILKEQKELCFLCDIDLSDKWPHLHHIDYNKKNCKEENLVFLCPKCHGKTNSNRSFWEEFIKEKLNGK